MEYCDGWKRLKDGLKEWAIHQRSNCTILSAGVDSSASDERMVMSLKFMSFSFHISNVAELKNIFADYS